MRGHGPGKEGKMKLKEDMRVCGGETPEEWDVGTVYRDGRRWMIAWDSEVSTPAPLWGLYQVGSRAARRAYDRMHSRVIEART